MCGWRLLDERRREWGSERQLSLSASRSGPRRGLTISKETFAAVRSALATLEVLGGAASEDEEDQHRLGRALRRVDSPAESLRCVTSSRIRVDSTARLASVIRCCSGEVKEGRRSQPPFPSTLGDRCSPLKKPAPQSDTHLPAWLSHKVLLIDQRKISRAEMPGSEQRKTHQERALVAEQVAASGSTAEQGLQVCEASGGEIIRKNGE